MWDKKYKDGFKFIGRAVAVILVMLLFSHYIVQLTVVAGHSMEPTLADGDLIILDKISSRLVNYQRDDIIVFPVPADQDKNYIKRIVGLPGDKIDIIDQCLYVNDQKLSGKNNQTIYSKGDMPFPLTVPKDLFFVLGDNRGNSKDSRLTEIGLIKESEILGKTWIRLFPISKFGRIE